MYLDDNNDRYPSAWTSLVSTEYPIPGYERYCRWHDPRYPMDGPLFKSYIAEDKVMLCPTFNIFGIQLGQNHPAHDPAIPVEPYYSYSMNVFLGSRSANMYNGIIRRSEITRSKAEVFFFAEENIWIRPGNGNVLNDTTLCSDGRDWFGTFHNTTYDKLNAGTVNAGFVDGHVQQVRSALKEDPGDTSEMELGQFEKYGWPHKEPYK